MLDVGNGVISIPANTSSIPINFQIKGDDFNEGKESFKIRITDPPSNAVFTDGVTELEAIITIVDDELPTLSVDRSTLTVSESAGTTHVGLSLSGPSSETVVVNYSTSIANNDTALQTDFTAQSTTTTISSDSTSGLIAIPITNDSDIEENETFTVTLSVVSGAVFSGSQSNIVIQVTIIDDEGLPILTLGSQNSNINEETALAEILLNLSTAPTETVSITYSTTEKTATSNVDYTQQTNVTSIITSGTIGRIYIPIIDDNSYEGNEEFSVIITQISGAAYGSGIINTPIDLTITDNDLEPTLTIFAYTCGDSEPIPRNFTISESAGNMIFNAKLSHPSKTPVTFNYSTEVNNRENFASKSDFYVSNSIQYSIHPGITCIEILTPLIHDELFEEDEQFDVEFTNSSVTTFNVNKVGLSNNSKFEVKILDDDPIIWNIDDLTILEGDTNTNMNFYVYSNNYRTEENDSTSIIWTASTESGDTATFREDYAPDHNSHTRQVSILGGKNFFNIERLETSGDTIYEPDETFTVTLSSPGTGFEIGDGVAIGTILNDDPKPTLSTSTNANVNEADESLDIVINLSNQTVEEISLRYSTTNGTAVGGTDFIAQTNQTLTIPALATSSTIKIPIMDDNIYEGLESFTVTLSEVNNATFPFLAETLKVNVAINESKRYSRNFICQLNSICQ